MLESAKVGELVTKDFPELKGEDVISLAIPLFKKWRKEIPVFEGKEFKGMLSPLDLLDPKLDVERTKVGHLARPYPKLDEKDNILEAGRLMVESYSSALPVFSNQNFLGLVRIEDILRLFFEHSGLRKEKAKSLVRRVKVFEENASLGKIINYLWEGRRDFAILSWKNSFFVLHLCDLLENALKPKEKIGFGDKIKDVVAEPEIMARDFYSYQLFLLPANLSFKEVLEEMERMGKEVIGIEEEGELLGIISKKSMLAEVLGLYREGERVFVRFEGDYYALPLFEQGLFRKSVVSLAQKLERKYGQGCLKVRVKKYGEKNRYEINVGAFFPKNSFHAREEGFKPLDILEECLKKLEREAFEY